MEASYYGSILSNKRKQNKGSMVGVCGIASKLVWLEKIELGIAGKELGEVT